MSSSLVWRGYYAHGTGSEILAQRFEATGHPTGTEFVANSRTAPEELKVHPIVAMTPQCDAIVSWRRLIQGPSDRADVVVRRLSEDPDTEADVRINTFEGNPLTDFDLEAEMAANRNGHIVVVWPSREDGDGGGIVARSVCLDDPKYLACGNPTCVGGLSEDPNAVNTTDALAVLRAAVHLTPCIPCLCDTNGSGTVAATDALLVLRRALGLQAQFSCPPCMTEG